MKVPWQKCFSCLGFTPICSETFYLPTGPRRTIPTLRSLQLGTTFDEQVYWFTRSTGINVCLMTVAAFLSKKVEVTSIKIPVEVSPAMQRIEYHLSMPTYH
jgi:hypothetical protein